MKSTSYPFSPKIFNISNLFRSIVSCCLILVLVPLISSAQTFPKSPKPWRSEYNFSTGGVEFSHPMTVMNQEEHDIIRQRITDGIEPQKTACSRLISEAANQLKFTPDAPATMNIMGGYEPNSNLSQMRDWLWRNCHAAYTCALAYSMTGDSVYAEKAREILMNWANMSTTFTGGDRGLQLGSWFSPMLYAADLINDYPGWTEAERDTFEAWWRTNCLIYGDVLDVMRSRDNNWKDAGLLGVFAAAIVFEDSVLLKEGLIQLKSYFFGRWDDYVDNTGLYWKIRKSNDVVYLPREVTRNEGSSGLTYTAYSLTTMVQCLEIARYAGFNFWYDETEEGATIQELIEQYYRWDINNEPFPWHASPGKTTKRRNAYELANSRFELDENMKYWIKTHRPLSGREGDEYITLNKGDMFTEPAGVNEKIALPLAYRLSHNYPNPFNSITVLQYEIEKSCLVSLQIYNARGEAVSTLFNGYRNTGSYRIAWDSDDMPSGIYFCRLTAKSRDHIHTETKKMIKIN